MPNKILFDYSNLRGEIRKKYTNLSDFAADLQMNPTTLYLKLKKGTPLTNETISNIVDVLQLNELSGEQYKSLFFLKLNL